MRKVMIQEKLKQLQINTEDLILGDFDAIGEYTAKKMRDPGTENYNNVGCYFRPNYERGILMHYMIQQLKLKSILEIGFGRGYATFCMARAMCQSGIEGKITTVDPNLDEKFLNHLAGVFPKEWFEKVNFVKATSDDFFRNLTEEEKYDFIYIDGDHRYESVKNDWENSKNRFKSALLFDDYSEARNIKDVDCGKLIDEIEGYNKELIIGDRRIFLDDRGKTDDEINYGQVLVTK